MRKNFNQTALPLKLQFFAEGGDGNTDTSSEGANIDTSVENGNEPDTQTVTVEELQAQLAKANAEFAKQKNALDKALKEKGELSKSLRAKQTTEEQEAEERERVANEQKQQYEAAIAELNLMKAQNAYTGKLVDNKAINNLISAVDEKDHQSIALIIENEKKAAVKAAKMEWYKDSPQQQLGGGSASMTREDILAITDPIAQLEALAKNPNIQL